MISPTTKPKVYRKGPAEVCAGKLDVSGKTLIASFPSCMMPKEPWPNGPNGRKTSASWSDLSCGGLHLFGFSLRWLLSLDQNFHSIWVGGSGKTLIASFPSCMMPKEPWPNGPNGRKTDTITSLGGILCIVRPSSLPAQTSAGPFLYTFGFVVGLIMWGFALVWLFFALASITRSKFPLHILETVIFSTNGLKLTVPKILKNSEGSSFAMVVVATVNTPSAGIVVLLWIVVSAGTIIQTCRKKIFVAPCLKEWERLEAERCGRE
jgi:hypothetical protein